MSIRLFKSIPSVSKRAGWHQVNRPQPGDYRSAEPMGSSVSSCQPYSTARRIIIGC